MSFSILSSRLCQAISQYNQPTILISHKSLICDVILAITISISLQKVPAL